MMKKLLHLAVLLGLLSTRAHAERKYGFFAESDAMVLDKVHDPEIDAAILGCVYKLSKLSPPEVKNSIAIASYVTVIESYKGQIAVGQKIAIVIYSETAPAEEKELGNLRFFLLRNKRPGAPDVPAGEFTCDWNDIASFTVYGEPLRKLLRESMH